MRDSLGGTVIITIIVFFLVFASAYLAYNVNYMKAFNMKNKIISIYNKYDGDCNTTCASEIKTYADSIGYNPATINCSNYTNVDSNGLYCYSQVMADKSDSSYIWVDGTEYYYYTIMTKVDIHIPIVSNTLGFDVQTLSGETTLFKCNKSEGCKK